ncbi:unnamed protein product [Nippostrongylus brasiliensis]|uniref:Ion_trans_2 domain-containing protein n=1 Tax=Nippostrongylus brasiliensis TaxID=27835 RepID=A0A0N4XF25_NIPBR|nr:unnamed protein product [Nippostrongylus brasiliensis]
MTTTTFIFFYDALSGPPDSGISYFLSFYFSFISISTIGLGDVMPNNVTMTKSRAVTLTDGNQAQMQEMTDPRNEVTIGSLLTFIKSDAHVYGRQFGRLNLTARKETV